MEIKKLTYNEFLSYKNVSRETFFRLEEYVRLLEKWQKTINLISKSTISDIWIRHIIDSVQLVDYVLCEDVVADIGSGAGFPGLVLGILGIKNMTLIESDTRKVAFLREVARVTNTDIKLVNKRVEEMSLSDFSTITARGFAPLKTMLDSFGNTLATSCNLLLLKGKNYKLEIREALTGWAFDYETYPSITEPGGVILRLRNLNKREL